MAIKKKKAPTAHVEKTPAKTQAIRVRATALGYYEHKRRRAGDVFLYQAPVDRDGDVTLPSWLEEAASASLKETGAQAALNENSAVLRDGAAAAPTASGAGDDLGI
jgi:hypothetical protein